MKLTVSIREQSKIATFLNLIKEMDYVNIVDVVEEPEEIPSEHRDLLDKRLLRIKNGEATFKDWNLIKRKYEGEEI